MDNSTAFFSEGHKVFLDKWNVRHFLRVAYRACGNGIIERNHMIIKAIAEREIISPLEAVFWYNISPRSGQEKETVPQRAVFWYDWTHPIMVPEASGDGGQIAKVQIGDEV